MYVYSISHPCCYISQFNVKYEIILISLELLSHLVNDTNFFKGFPILFVTELEITNFTSIPDGYGIRNDQLTFSCQFSPALDAQNVVIEWYRNGALVATTGADEDFIISSFQPSHSGNYSCSVLVMVGNIVLGGAQSVEKSIKLAGTYQLFRFY